MRASGQEQDKRASQGMGRVSKRIPVVESRMKQREEGVSEEWGRGEGNSKELGMVQDESSKRQQRGGS